MQCRAARLGRAILGALLIVTALPAYARDTLKVCADPNYLPYSSEQGGGFENEIAKLLAEELGIGLEYSWFPQRMGFIRNTLRAPLPEGGYKCDLVMGLPTGYELAVTTEPYYYSTYALVFLDGNPALEGVDSVASLLALSDERKQGLRFGMAERNPGGGWLRANAMLDRLTVAFPSQPGDPNVRPGQLEQDGLLAGDFDATVMWGPIAGYFAKSVAQDKSVVVLPLESTPSLRLHFAISAGVRFGEGEWKDEVNGLLEKNRDRIRDVLSEFGVPLVDKDGNVL